MGQYNTNKTKKILKQEHVARIKFCADTQTPKQKLKLLMSTKLCTTSLCFYAKI